tara:strand:- start:860 stop:3235 length:2376 start_codon:yes stop_codon:yes gene_type:complete
VIVKGGSRAGAPELAAHLQRVDTNERMEVLDVRGTVSRELEGALREMEAMSSGTRCKNPLYHASINVPIHERLGIDNWERAVDRLEEELGLTGQPRAVVMHEKFGREHVHVVWGRVRTDTLVAVADSHNYRKHEIVARELEREFGHERVQGAHAERDGVPRPERTLSHAEHQIAERTGIDPKAVTAEITALWQAADGAEAFLSALAEAGYRPALGARRQYVVLDAYGTVHSLSRRIEGIRVADLRRAFADIDPSQLPAIDTLRTDMRAEASLSPGPAREDAPEIDPMEVFSGLLRNQSFVTEGEIHRALLSKGVLAPALLIDTIASHDDTVRLYDPATQEEVGWTQQSIRDQEKATVGRATAMAASADHEIGTRFIRTVAKEMTLDDEQTEAMRHVLDAGSLKILEGRAGTGKSHTLSAIRQAAERDGYSVVGLAPTNAVAQDLRDSGFERATTVHSLLWYRDHAPDHGNAQIVKKSLIIVDEAAMLDTQRLDALTQLATDTGAKLVLVGDDRQLASIERGGVFTAIREKTGSTALTTVRRQHHDWAKQASRDFAEGRFREGLEAYDAHDLVHWRDDLEAARASLLERWQADTETERGTRFVFAYTNEEVRRLNDAMQAIEIERGRVKDCITVETERGTLSVGVGDRIAFRGTWKPKGIYAGALATVEVIDGDRVTVRSDRGREITFDTRDYTNIDLGYAGTIYRGQGKTLDQTYLLHTHHWRDAASYVAMTRARGQTEVFVGKDQASGLPALAEQMSRQSDRGATLRYVVEKERLNEQILSPERGYEREI